MPMVLEENIGLFENWRKSHAESTASMIEDVLLELGHFINDCRVEQHNATYCSWKARKGSAEVLITLVDRQDSVYIVATSTVVKLTKKVDELSLYRRLLKLNNNEVSGAAFALDGPYVLISAECPTLHLDRSQVMNLIERIQNYADHYDDILVTEFSADFGSSAPDYE